MYSIGEKVVATTENCLNGVECTIEAIQSDPYVSYLVRYCDGCRGVFAESKLTLAGAE